MREEWAKDARILVVDDEPQNTRYLKDVLDWAGYENVECFTEPREALDRFRRHRPDLVILDLLMPEMDGFELMRCLKEEIPADEYLPFLILTSDTSRESRRRALSEGARDFITKPMSPTEVRFRVANLLDTRGLYLELIHNGETGDPASVDASDVDDPIEILERWGGSLAASEDGDGDRAKRVSWLAGTLAGSLGLSEPEAGRVRRAALLCRLGSVSGAERAAEALEGTTSPSLELARQMILHGADRWDGDGGQPGRSGQAIPLVVRIVAVAEAFDRLTHGMEEQSWPDALAQIEREAGGRFDPAVVEALVHAHAIRST